MPYKRYAAATIGGFLHEVLHDGRPPAVVARDAGITRQTGAVWLKQFGLMAPAHLTELVPAVAAAAGQSPPLTPVPVPARTGRRGRDLLVRTWGSMLAVAARRLGGVARADHPVHLLEWLQPELARLRPAAGLFRVPLHERARAPPA